MNGILICCGCSQISELFHTFKGFVTYLHVVLLSYKLASRHDHILSFLSIYFYTNLLTSSH